MTLCHILPERWGWLIWYIFQVLNFHVLFENKVCVYVYIYIYCCPTTHTHIYIYIYIYNRERERRRHIHVFKRLSIRKYAYIYIEQTNHTDLSTAILLLFEYFLDFSKKFWLFFFIIIIRFLLGLFSVF